MNEENQLLITDRWIISARGTKNPVDTSRPYGCMVEKELTASGKLEDTAIIFLTNMECPFHCLMCDLWKNTTDQPVPPGAIPVQIEYALAQLPEVKHVKLYNSGSFFDTRAIAENEYEKIASLLSGFDTVIVESHPRFIDKKCVRFRDMISGELEIAIGLEAADDEMLRRINKRMTTDEFRQAVRFLRENDIRTRAFILLRPPFLSEEEGIEMAERSLRFAFSTGVECCTVIPVRPGNGAINILREKGSYTPPDIGSLERVLEYGISLGAGRVFADTWDLKLFSKCGKCLGRKTDRIIEMNNTQKIADPVECMCNVESPGLSRP